MYIKNIRYLLVLFLFLSFITTEASYTNGTIDSVYQSALLCTNDTCTTYSQINFKPTLGNPVSITDSGITGNIWSETFGWVNLNPNYGGVTNTSSGVLGGYAWGDGAGWINFAPTQGGVTINTSGQFSGFAWSENYGWIKFDCGVVNACVATDWRPLSSRPSITSSGSMPPVPIVVPSIVTPVVEPSFPISIEIVKKPIVEVYNPEVSIVPQDDNNFINPQPEDPPIITTPDTNSSKKLVSSLSSMNQKEAKFNISFFNKLNNSIIQLFGFVESNIFSNYFMGVSLSYNFFGYSGYINPFWIVLFIIITIFILVILCKKKILAFFKAL